MKNHQLSLSPELQSTEADNQPLDPTKQKEATPSELSKSWTTDRILQTVRQQWKQLNWSLIWMILAVKGLIFVFAVFAKALCRV